MISGTFYVIIKCYREKGNPSLWEKGNPSLREKGNPSLSEKSIQVLREQLRLEGQEHLRKYLRITNGMVVKWALEKEC